MNTEIISLIIFGCVVGAVLIGKAFHRLLPEDHLSADTKETVKLAMGLLATMSALLFWAYLWLLPRALMTTHGIK
jgi:maleate cis-trans isomerase